MHWKTALNKLLLSSNRSNWKGFTRPRLEVWMLRLPPSGKYSEQYNTYLFAYPSLCLFFLNSSCAFVFRKDLSVSQRECEEVKVLLKHKEKQAAEALRADGAPRVAGLCLKCAQHEAVLTGSRRNPDLQTIDRLTQSVETHKHTHKSIAWVTS